MSVVMCMSVLIFRNTEFQKIKQKFSTDFFVKLSSKNFKIKVKKPQKMQKHSGKRLCFMKKLRNEINYMRSYLYIN